MQSVSFGAGISRERQFERRHMMNNVPCLLYKIPETFGSGEHAKTTNIFISLVNMKSH